MKFNVYLPDEVGDRAKAAEPELNLSRLLRDAVEEELARRVRVAAMLKDSTEHELALESQEGTRYTGVLTGKQLTEERDGVIVYFTTDERVMAYDINRSAVEEIRDADDWRDADVETYLAIAGALGQPARVEV